MLTLRGWYSDRTPRPDLCPRYVGKIVDNVRFGYSPVNLERRLYLAGQRPLNLIVDIANYVMLETASLFMLLMPVNWLAM